MNENITLRRATEGLPFRFIAADTNEGPQVLVPLQDVKALLASNGIATASALRDLLPETDGEQSERAVSIAAFHVAAIKDMVEKVDASEIALSTGMDEGAEIV